MAVPSAWAASPSAVPPLVNNVVEISTAAQLEYLDQNQSTYLTDNIELLTNIALPTPTTPDGSNWEPFGEGSAPFSGQFNGQGYAITNIEIDQSSESEVGFFGYNKGSIQDLVLDASVIDGEGQRSYAGILAGVNVDGSVTNVMVNGSVSGSAYVGGLIGLLIDSSNVTNIVSTANVTGTSSGAVIGGLVGNATQADSVTNAAATGFVSGSAYDAGGLFGSIENNCAITNAYASGAVSGGTNSGGLFGYFDAEAPTDDYFDTTTTGQTTAVDGETPAGVTAESNAAMQTASTYAGWNFSTVWELSPTVNGGLPMIAIPAVPNAPQLTSATPQNGQVTLQWTLPTNTEASPLTTTAVYAVYGSGASAGAFTLALGPTVTTTTVPDLTNGTAYTFSVTATNALGTSPASNALTATPATLPSAPQNLTGTAGDGEATLQWTLPSNTSGSSLTATAVYAVYGSGASAGAFTESLGPTATTDTLTSLTNGLTYRFEVTDSNSVGASVYSNPVPLTPEAPSLPPPVNPSPPTTTAPPPAVQQTATGVAIPVGDTVDAAFGFANRDGATIHFPTPTDQSLVIAVRRRPGVPNGIAYVRDLFNILEISVTVAGDPSGTVEPLPRTDTVEDASFRTLPVGTQVVEWDASTQQWVVVTTITHANTTSITLPLPNAADVFYAFRRPSR